jgi:hypothetical protein
MYDYCEFRIFNMKYKFVVMDGGYEISSTIDDEFGPCKNFFFNWRPTIQLSRKPTNA